VIDPEFNEVEILQLVPPILGSNAPAIPPRYASPITDPLKVLLEADGRELEHDMFWSPSDPAKPPT
jgi:hypothetical protein